MAGASERAYATITTIAREEAIARCVEAQVARSNAPATSVAQVDVAMSRAEERLGRALTDGQRQAVEAVCTSGRGVDLVVRVAGWSRCAVTKGNDSGEYRAASPGSVPHRPRHGMLVGAVLIAALALVGCGGGTSNLVASRADSSSTTDVPGGATSTSVIGAGQPSPTTSSAPFAVSSTTTVLARCPDSATLLGVWRTSPESKASPGITGFGNITCWSTWVNAAGLGNGNGFIQFSTVPALHVASSAEGSTFQSQVCDSPSSPQSWKLSPSIAACPPRGASPVARDIAAFVGTWGAHETTLVFDDTGTAHITYADLSLCPSCSLASAPRGTLVFTVTAVTNGVGTGQVTASSDPKMWTVGAPVHVRIVAGAPGQLLSVDVDGKTLGSFCNSTSAGQCGI